MQGKSFGIIAVLVTLVATGGYFIGKYNSESDLERLFYMGEANVMVSRIQALSAIRKGKTEEALRWLENGVDGNLLVLSPYKETALEENDKLILSALKFASTYRNYYKPKSEPERDPDVEKAIEQALQFGKMHGQHRYGSFVDKYISPNKSLNSTPRSGAN